MRYFFKVVVGFLCALISAVAIHGLAIKRPVDPFTFAYRTPMAIFSPVYVVNAMALSEEFYHSISWNLMRKAGLPYLGSTPPDIREEAHSKGMVYGHLFSGVLTAAFWLPVIFLFRKKRSKLTSP